MIVLLCYSSKDSNGDSKKWDTLYTVNERSTDIIVIIRQRSVTVRETRVRILS